MVSPSCCGQTTYDALFFKFDYNNQIMPIISTTIY
jgi:hypothetical protein